MLILADGESVRDLVPDDPSIRLLELDGNPTIGDKRNLGGSRAGGSVIAHWDDDDHSAPERLTDQIRRLIDSGQSVTGYCSMRFTDGSRSWLYRGATHYAIGTSLCYRRDWWQSHPFPGLQVGEDGAFAATAHQAGQLTTAEAGELMHATIHPGNTSPRQLTGRQWVAL